MVLRCGFSMKSFNKKILVMVSGSLCLMVSAGFITKHYIDKQCKKHFEELNKRLDYVNDCNKNTFYKLALKESLRKYRYVFDKEYDIPKNYVNKYPNRIWVYWDKGFENAPKVVKICLESIKKHSAGRIVETLDENNFDKYIKVPDYIIKKYKSGKMMKAVFSDIIRTLLLRDYGGTWIDATTYIVRDIPQCIFDAEFLAPLECCISDTRADFFVYRDHEIIANYFLSTNAPHNRFFQCMAEFLLESWKEMDGMPYFSWYGFAAIASEEDPVISKIMHNLYNNINKAFSSDFFKLAKAIDYNLIFSNERWEDIKKFPIQKFCSRMILERSSKDVKPGTFLDKLLKGELQ